jgi:hypothetical protein
VAGGRRSSRSSTGAGPWRRGRRVQGRDGRAHCQEQASREQDLLREENTLIDSSVASARRSRQSSTLDKLVQQISDETAALVRASFGAFFYNVVARTAKRTRCSRSPAPRPRRSRTSPARRRPCSGRRSVASAWCASTTWPRAPHFGKEPPFFGMPPGHLPVKSYLAAP